MPPIAMTSGNLAEEANKLLDFSQKLDINLLDNVVTMMYSGNGPQVIISLNTILKSDVFCLYISYVLLYTGIMVYRY